MRSCPMIGIISAGFPRVRSMCSISIGGTQSARWWGATDTLSVVSRDGHKLGFLRDNSCELVEDVDVRPNESLPATEISAYQAGRCLDVQNSSVRNRANVRQQTCNGGPSQKWQVRSKG